MQAPITPAERFKRWPWRDFGHFQITRQQAEAQALYAAQLYEAHMGGTVSAFDRAALVLLAPTSDFYRRRPTDWVEGSRII